MGIVISESMRRRIREKARVLSRCITLRDVRQLEELLDAIEREEISEETLERLGHLLTSLEETSTPEEKQEEERTQEMCQEQRCEINAVRLVIIRQIRNLMQQVLKSGRTHGNRVESRKR